MKTILTPAGRLIVAADFKPNGTNGRIGVRKEIVGFAKKIKGTGVYLKFNSALRAIGYDLIDEIKSYGLNAFADLKLIDIKETLSTDGALLRETKPDILTVMCVAGVDAMRALKQELPDTEILGVTVLTSLNENDTKEMFCATVEAAAMKFALLAETAGLDGFICAPTDIGLIRSVVKQPMTFNTPAIRPLWSVVANDDQNKKRIMTPSEAIKAGADRIVVGRPIIQAENPYDAVMRTIDEIASVM